MRSQLDVRLGSQEPVVLHQPPDVVSLAAAEEAIELADAYGVADGFPLAESQKLTLRSAMGERADGKWAATRVGDFGPRQGTGKNDKIAARELWGLLIGDEQLIIHTAHEFPTANEAFLRLASVFESWDELGRLVARIRYGNGTQGIDLRSGQRILYKARTGGSGRGFAKASLVVYDEAQHLTREHVAASGPTKLSNPNGQTWYAGSGGFETSVVAWAMRRQAILGTGGRLAYTEMTGETITVAGGVITTTRPDPSDLDAWYRSMAGLGRWVTEESMRALYDELGADLFARECLCVWDPEPGEDGSIIPTSIWAALADTDSKIVTHRKIALDVSHDRQFASFGAAGRREDGLLHVEAFDRRPGTGWVLERAAELAHRWRVPIRIERTSPAGAFIDQLSELGVAVEEVSAADHAQAVGQFIDAALNDGLRHLGETHLSTALRNAVVRPSGDAQMWGRRLSKADISALVAVTVALGGVPTGRGKPRIHVLENPGALATK
jgi:hypothetical protein